MNRDNSNRIIGDIIEINSDIIDKRIHSKSKKFITNLKEKYYRYRLNRIIKQFKKKLILNKYNIEELFSYIFTYYQGRYQCIQKIKINNTADNNITVAEVVIDANTDEINNIRYYITINNNPNMDIIISTYKTSGEVDTKTVQIANLYNYKVEDDIELKYLNTSLVDVLTSFLNEYLDRFKIKGYLKEVKE